MNVHGDVKWFIECMMICEHWLGHVNTALGVRGTVGPKPSFGGLRLPGGNYAPQMGSLATDMVGPSPCWGSEFLGGEEFLLGEPKF